MEKVNNIGVAMTGGKTTGREENDFYPTPPEVTQAILDSPEGQILKAMPQRLIWEPCVGDGAMANVLKKNGFQIIAGDIIDRGYIGTEIQDFVTARWARSPILITNPPYNIAPKFILHAHRLKIEYMALLLKATFWNAISRYDLWRLYPPAAIYPLTWRPDFLGRGAPTMDTMWCVWRPTSSKTFIEPILRGGVVPGELGL
jgi:hypothetical protein